MPLSPDQNHTGQSSTGFEEDAVPVHLGHRIQIVPVDGSQPPVQTDTIAVVRMALNRSPHRATFDPVAGMQGCSCRFKGGDQASSRSVTYGHHRLSGHCTGENDGPRFRRQYQGILIGSQVHPPMPGKPVMRRPIEFPDRLRRRTVIRGPDRTHPPCLATSEVCSTCACWTGTCGTDLAGLKWFPGMDLGKKMTEGYCTGAKKATNEKPVDTLPDPQSCFP